MVIIVNIIVSLGLLLLIDNKGLLFLKLVPACQSVLHRVVIVVEMKFRRRVRRSTSRYEIIERWCWPLVEHWLLESGCHVRRCLVRTPMGLN